MIVLKDVTGAATAPRGGRGRAPRAAWRLPFSSVGPWLSHVNRFLRFRERAGTHSGGWRTYVLFMSSGSALYRFSTRPQLCKKNQRGRT